MLLRRVWQAEGDQLPCVGGSMDGQRLPFRHEGVRSAAHTSVPAPGNEVYVLRKFYERVPCVAEEVRAAREHYEAAGYELTDPIEYDWRPVPKIEVARTWYAWVRVGEDLEQAARRTRELVHEEFGPLLRP